jgi:NADPH:quinone reductase-like Zn-dependent oxidoreductase
MTLLKENKIMPVISTRMPLLQATEANQILESGNVSGKIVLVAPELLQQCEK